MRLLAITDLSGHMIGGPTTAAVQLLNGLASKGHEVVLMNDRAFPGLAAVSHVAMPLPLENDVAARVTQVIKNFDPDVVHLLSMGQFGLRRLASVVAGRAWVMTVHSISPYERIVRGLHRFDFIHYMARNLRYWPNTVGWRVLLPRLHASRIIVHSEAVRSVVIRYGAEPASVRVIDLAMEPPRSDAEGVIACRETPGPRIVTVAGVAHTKGLHDGVVAVARLRDDYPSLSYRIVGEIRDRSYERHLRSLITALNLENAVQIKVGVSDEERDAELLGADLYLQPSHEEGFCLAYLEAAQLVQRLVATATGAIPSISEGDPFARVVQPRRPDELAAAMRELLGISEVPRSELSERRLRLRSRLSWSRHVEEHERIYAGARRVARRPTC